MNFSNDISGQTREATILEALTSIAQCSQFVLVSTVNEDTSEIIGFGGAEPGILEGLQVALQHLTAKLQQEECSSDVSSLVQVICARS